MSEQSGLLSSEQSARLAGVSLETIDKYCQIGLLVPQVKDNERFFRESDIKSLFYTKSNYAALSSFQDKDKLQAYIASGDPAVEVEAEAAPEEAGAPEGAAELEEPPAESAESTEQEAAAADIDAEKAGEAAEQAPQPEPNVQARPGAAAAEQPSAVISDREANLLEMNQTLREQIELLREERDWLRQRIEHLETRGEREQMLLLAESETVRRLIKTETLTERLLKFRLPWFNNDHPGSK